MGPALVTADEIPDVQNLWLRTVIGDEVLQEGHTSLMIFSGRPSDRRHEPGDDAWSRAM